MDSVATTVTSGITIIIATFANIVTIDSFVTTVLIDNVATIGTFGRVAIGARLANILRTVPSLDNLFFAIPGSIVTSRTIERMLSNAIIAPDVAVRIFVHIGSIERVLTLGTNGLTQLFQTTATNRLAVNILVTVTIDKIATFVTLGRLQITLPKQTSLRNRHNPTSLCCSWFPSLYRVYPRWRRSQTENHEKRKVI
jgi:hypothetical protein